MFPETPVPVNTQLGIGRKGIGSYRYAEILPCKAYPEPLQRLVAELDVGKTRTADIPCTVNLR